MKIRHVVLTGDFAGVERHVCVLANAQARQGHDVEVWGGQPRSMRGVLDDSVAHRPAGTLLATAVRGIGAPSPDVWHAHMTRAEAACLLPTLVRREPLAVTRHFAAPRGSSVGGRALRRTIQRRVDVQIAVSRYVAQNIDGAATVIYPGVEPASPPTGPRQPVVLVVQRLQPEKDTDLALLAFAGGAPEGWRLEVVGEGREMGRLKGLAAELGISRRTTFLGFKDDVADRMRSASVLVAPCRVEGLGLSVLEAMARELPVLASRSGAHPETVGRAPDAQLFDPDDEPGTATMLARLCSDEELRARYGRQLAKIQRLAFTPDVQAEATEAVYDEARR